VLDLSDHYPFRHLHHEGKKEIHCRLRSLLQRTLSILLDVERNSLDLDESET